jgi:hypothetical protein
MSGYGITCDPGDLYTRRCYDAQGHEIIAYTSKGQPIGFDDATGKTYLTALDSSGNAYSPYPQGMPYTIGDAGAISSVAGKWQLSSGADPQWITRLLTLPGAQARIRAATTTVPWYYESTGLRHDPMPEESESGKKWWEFWKAEGFASEDDGFFHSMRSHLEEYTDENGELLPHTKNAILLGGFFALGSGLTLALTRWENE